MVAVYNPKIHTGSFQNHEYTKNQPYPSLVFGLTKRENGERRSPVDTKRRERPEISERHYPQK
jgi:hypothetical protein